jgi:alkyl hydroperoxide reductase subunit AhpC
LVDFDTNANLLESLGVKVIAGSVDSVAETATLAEGLRLRYCEMVAELDGPAIATATGAALQSGERVFLHATGFLVDPEGGIVNSVYSSGPIGRFTANDVLKKVIFEQARRAG